MKVLALGGCGGIGKYAVKTLVEQKICDRVIVADKDGKKAADFAAQMGDRVEPLTLDISNKSALDQAVAASDLVTNTIGPFFRFGTEILKTCIEKRCHYVDICDDWESTLNLLELNDRARAAGITAIVGLGVTPGISNVLAKKALLELDSAEQVFTGWWIDAAKPDIIVSQPSAATLHGIYQLTGSIRTFENGKYRDTRPVFPVDLDYPGMGMRRAYTIGHPEAVTIPRYYPTLKTSMNVFTTSKTTVMEIKALAWFINHKIVSVDTGARFAEKIQGPSDPNETPDWMIAQMANQRKYWLPPLFALVTGLKNGKPASVACAILSAPPGGMGGVTGIPLAIGASMILKKEITKVGVFAPEGILEPDPFLNAIAPLCSPVKSGLNDLVLTTRSWEKSDIDWMSYSSRRIK